MIKLLAIPAIVFAGAFSTTAYAQSDAAAGETAFRSCKSCHGIVSGDEVIVRGGKIGPNLFGIVGMTAGTVADFRYGDDTLAAGAAGLVWTEENLAIYLADPTDFLRTYLDDTSARSKMTYKLRRGAEDVAAYLASLNPAE